MTYPGPTLFPGDTTFPAPPVIQMAPLPGFADGQVPTDVELNAVASGVENLARISTGRGTGTSDTTGSPPTGRPAVKCYIANPVALVSGVRIPVAWDTTDLDTENQFRLPSPQRLVVQVDGWYRVELQAAFETAAPGERSANIHVGGSTLGQIVASSSTVTGAANDQRVQVVAVTHLTAGSTVYASVMQSSGLATTTISANTASGDTAITVADSIPAGTTVIIDPGFTDEETVLVTAVSGTGPYTLTVTTDLTGATAAGMGKAHFASYHVEAVVHLLPRAERGTWMSMRWIAPFGQGAADNPAPTDDPAPPSSGGGTPHGAGATPSSIDPDLYLVDGASPSSSDSALYRFPSPTPSSGDSTLFTV